MAKSKLFDNWTWRLPFPKPFDDPSISKTSTDVYSAYNSTSSKKSTLHGPTLQALLKYADLVNTQENGDDTTGMGALGHQNDKYLVAEYPGSKGIVCAAYARGTGKFYVARVETPGDPPQAYSISERDQTGSALIWTMMSEYMSDNEFSEAFGELRNAQSDGFPDIDAAARIGYLLCDNIYRRTENASNLGDVGVKMTIPGTGNVTLLTEIALQKPGAKVALDDVKIHMIRRMYLRYDINSEFWPQFERNVELLKREMQNAVKGKPLISE